MVTSSSHAARLDRAKSRRCHLKQHVHGCLQIEWLVGVRLLGRAGAGAGAASLGNHILEGQCRMLPQLSTARSHRCSERVKAVALPRHGSASSAGQSYRIKERVDQIAHHISRQRVGPRAGGRGSRGRELMPVGDQTCEQEEFGATGLRCTGGAGRPRHSLEEQAPQCEENGEPAGPAAAGSRLGCGPGCQRRSRARRHAEAQLCPARLCLLHRRRLAPLRQSGHAQNLLFVCNHMAQLVVPECSGRSGSVEPTAAQQDSFPNAEVHVGERSRRQHGRQRGRVQLRLPLLLLVGHNDGAVAVASAVWVQCTHQGLHLTEEDAATSAVDRRVVERDEQPITCRQRKLVVAGRLGAHDSRAHHPVALQIPATREEIEHDRLGVTVRAIALDVVERQLSIGRSGHHAVAAELAQREARGWGGRRFHSLHPG